MPTLDHYTDAAGYAGIMRDMAIVSSTFARRQSDVRYGDGVYLTDLAPGTLRASRLLRRIIGQPFPRSKVAYHVGVDIRGLEVSFGRDHVYVIPGRGDLDIRGRLVADGPTIHPETGG